ncbi:hypothetical protein Rsub_04377 [Raphidocelis subcapitata]|uniref:Uncharacterized protein n=1 Tax=Raphidocelis subcapitata TaxID=307507 RepID=A0A2V0P2F8_9CHLO|nr:hypothetical protein Rsub_04377 [Raphidocelis subcapitata]|eukprot:GBF92030.1 hypothetical protein Rsub_04377 [Raphidocelis subcapitata]
MAAPPPPAAGPLARLLLICLAAAAASLLASAYAGRAGRAATAAPAAAAAAAQQAPPRLVRFVQPLRVQVDRGGGGGRDPRPPLGTGGGDSAAAAAEGDPLLRGGRGRGEDEAAAAAAAAAGAAAAAAAAAVASDRLAGVGAGPRQLPALALVEGGGLGGDEGAAASAPGPTAAVAGSGDDDGAPVPLPAPQPRDAAGAATGPACNCTCPKADGAAAEGGLPRAQAAAVRSAGAAGAAESGAPGPPAPMRFPLWWHGPVWSGSGYGSEAVNFVLSLLRSGLVRPEDVWSYNHGDHARRGVVERMDPSDRSDLEAAAARPAALARSRAAIVCCHSMPPNYAVPDAAYWAGEQCPPDPKKYGVNAMNEVWVPSEWQRGTFVASGVDPGKIRVVPEGVNTSQFDPARHAPLPDLESRAQLVFGLSWAEKLAAAGAAAEAGPGAAADAGPGAPGGGGDGGGAAAGEGARPPLLRGPRRRAAQRGGGRRPFRFVSSFKWEPRKGWDVLLEAYLSEFGPEDPVELVILTKPFSGSGDEASRFSDQMLGWAEDKFGAAAAGEEQQPGAATGPQQAAAGAPLPEAAAAAAGEGAAAADGPSQVGGAGINGEARLDDLSTARRRRGVLAAGTAGADGAGSAGGGADDGDDDDAAMRRHVSVVTAAIRRFAAARSTGSGGEGPQRSLLGGGGAFNASAYPTLYVFNGHLPDEDFPRFYASGDAFVLPSRGEGWGRPHVEAMSMALPVIATNWQVGGWSGVTAFLDESVGYPLPIDGLAPASGEWWFRGLNWARPSVRHLRALMRRVVERREEAAARGAAARARMVERYSPPAIARLLLSEIRRIEALLPEV